MISKPCAKYKFCAIHPADIGDQVTNPARLRSRLSIKSVKVHRLYPPIKNDDVNVRVRLGLGPFRV